MKHTKGPWELIPDQDYPTIDQIWSTDEFPTYIARTCYAHKPNANLIACAPEMLELLIAITNANPNDGSWNYQASMSKAQDLITKATGGE